MDPQIERWRRYLRRDPTRFLLDAEANPSVYLWYLMDIAHRPENSSAVVEARDRVLYSTPVQEIFAAQQPEGGWEPAESLAEPRYRATVWNLALLAELGIPRDSRRARAACEFVLQNFLEEDGHFRSLDVVASGYLIHALAYFNLASDERVRRAAQGLIERVSAAADAQVQLLALWGWQDFVEVAGIRAATSAVGDRWLGSLATRGDAGLGPITFPQFEPRDPLFILRVLAAHGLVADPRASHLIERVIPKQNEWAQWPLEKSLNGSLVPRLEDESEASRWATLNAIRVIVRLVASSGSAILK
jgi:hypothetical protein